MNYNENLKRLRDKLDAVGADAVLVSMNNFFGNFDAEYSGIASISGFTGSNGRAIISKNRAILSVDGRYTKQASEQTDNAVWEIKMYPEFDTNALTEEILKPSQMLAIGAFSITYKSYLSLLNASEKFGFLVKILDKFLLSEPKKSSKNIYLIDNDRKSRILRIQETLTNDEIALLTDSAVIGWIFGVRCAPNAEKCVLPNCVAVIPHYGKPMLFSDLMLENKCNEFEFFNIEQFENVTKGLPKSEFVLDYSRTSLYFPEVLQRNGFSIKQAQINYGMFEAIKSEVEIKNMKIACEKASLAFIKTLAFVENVTNTSEVEIAEFFENELKKYDDFVSLSFNSISAFDQNTSIVHYNPMTHGNKKIDSDGLFLFDAGAHFKTATTDMTRTIYRGVPAYGTKKIYTSILKSVILFSSARFPDKSKAYSIDAIARFFVWNEGYDYHFGTGHGVGSFANVHEHPRISFNSNEEITGNMVVTVEPGIYSEDFGIRLENMLLTKLAAAPGFIEFETLNFIPFSQKLIDSDMLSNVERDWLNEYHQKIFDKFANCLSEDDVTLNWLKENTRKI
ncbi:MAG: M24 family metallopeptidase [Alphaproteobacteria bacterium]|nr:M24 family metallopeptidase [Alphaproteobacteria bacterium]